LNKLLFLIAFCLAFNLNAKHKLKIYYQKQPNGYIIYADNDEYCEMSAKITFNLQNLEAEDGDVNTYVIPPKAKKFKLTQLKIQQPLKGYRLRYQVTSNYGNTNLISYNQNYIYSLPFEEGKRFKVNQGYHGRFSHQGKNALDFTMPVGTKVMAIRAGKVIKVVKDNYKNCKTKACAKYNNFVLIQHNDGTFAEYVHLKQNGVTVNVGDTVKKGEFLALSGNTGFSTGPHLHIQVFLQHLNKRITIKTKFLTGKGNTVEYLNEKETYYKNY